MSMKRILILGGGFAGVECCLNLESYFKNKSDVEILAIGIGHDVSRYYKKAIKITDVQELGDVMISQLSGLFENKKKLN